MTKTAVALAAIFTLALGTGSVFAAKHKHHSKARRIVMSVTSDGFTPNKVSVKRGEAVVLAVTRKTDKTCATEVIVHVTKTKTIRKKLPLNKLVEIPVTFGKTGSLSYACGMGHVRGIIQVQ